MFILSIFYFSC